MKVESKEDIVAVHAVVDADIIFATITKLKAAGAFDILVMPIERMIP